MKVVSLLLLNNINVHHIHSVFVILPFEQKALLVFRSISASVMFISKTVEFQTPQTLKKRQFLS